MKKTYLPSLILLILLCFLSACENDIITSEVKYYTAEEYQTISAKLDLPESPHSYNRFSFEGGSHVDIMGTLGRVLFYDKNLSSDNSVSCASCHKQHLAFADDVAFSTGIMNRSTARNSLALGVFRSFGDYSQDPVTTLFWDGRVDNLHDQMIQTIGNPNEMGMELEDVVAKIKDIDYYKILAKKTFVGFSGMNETLILSALEEFMNSMTANHSKFDNTASRNSFVGQTPSNWEGFTAQENLGKSLFQTNCVSCHGTSLEELTFEPIIRSANNGLDLVYSDKGAGEFNPSPELLAIFKAPSLRNIALTAPYMHDGRFATLEEVVDFYSEVIQDHPNLHPNLKENAEPIKFHFTENEKDALVQFFKTLTDHTMQNEAKWSDPFL